MDLSMLKLGQVFSSKAQLYRAIGVEPAKGTKNRKYQDREIGRYISFIAPNKNKRNIIITEIFDEPKPKIDNRGKHGNQTGNSKYSKDMDTLIIAMMQRESSLDATYNYIFINMIPILTKQYERPEYYNSFLLSHEHFIQYNTINTYLQTITTKVQGAFLRSLNRLKKEGKIDYELLYKVQYSEGAGTSTASGAELEIIKEFQYKIREEMEIGSNQFIAHKQRIQYRIELLKALRENTNIYSYWHSYNITLSNKNLKSISNNEVKSALKNISHLFIVSTHKTLINKTGLIKNDNSNKEYKPFMSRYQIAKIIKLDSLYWTYFEEVRDKENRVFELEYGYIDTCSIRKSLLDMESAIF